MSDTTSMTMLLEKIPRWHNIKGELILPMDVLRVAADILEAVRDTAQSENRKDMLQVMGITIDLLRAVSAGSGARPVSGLPRA